MLSVCLGTSYLVEVEIFFVKSVENRLKNKLNSIVKPMNSIKKCSKTHE